MATHRTPGRPWLSVLVAFVVTVVAFLAVVGALRVIGLVP